MNFHADYYHLFSTLSTILDRDGEVKFFHGLRTAIIATYLAKNIMPDEATLILYLGLLHDVGGVGLSHHMVHYGINNIFDHPQVKYHSEISAEIISRLPGLNYGTRYIKEHHERWDGRGFPYGLKGKELSRGGQILMLADQFDLLLRKTTKRNIIYNTFRKEKGKMFNPSLWPHLLDILGNHTLFYQLTSEHHLYNLLDRLQETLPPLKFSLISDDFLLRVTRVFGQIIDAKHPYTQGHSQRVAGYSKIIAESLGLKKEEIRSIELASYLHDLGKVSIPLHILDKTGQLNDEEYEIIKSHVTTTMELLDYIPSLRHLSSIAGSHHERWDGSGYPDGLEGTEIPLGGRIIALADALDALTSDRTYHRAEKIEKAILKLQKEREKHFDPQITDILDNPQVVNKIKKVREKINEELDSRKKINHYQQKRPG